MQTFGFPLMLALAAPIQITAPHTGATDRSTFSLSSARDRLRPLLLFAPKSSDFRLLRQLEILQKDALLERNIVIVPITLAGTLTLTPHLDPSVVKTISAQDSTTTRSRFRVAPDEFTLVLLGKDGEEKFRSALPVPGETISQIVDGMPMRQQEMKAKPSR